MKALNVLSLFDGMSCGQVALNRAGVRINKYFSSEIDKHAIKVTKNNYPKTVHLGDIRNITASDLPKIDLIIGGSPCQGFSSAGKKLNFEDERSSLFFEYIRLLRELKPENFLMENVKMKKEWVDIISGQISLAMGLDFSLNPIEINSNLVSAQNRKRLYWCSGKGITQPRDKEIYLKDIIQYDVKGDLSDEFIDKKLNQSRWGNHFGTINTKKSNTLLAIGKCDVILLRDLKRYLTPVECERLQTLRDNYTDSVSNHQRYKMIGNGWTVDVLSHIFRGMYYPN